LIKPTLTSAAIQCEQCTGGNAPYASDLISRRAAPTTHHVPPTAPARVIPPVFGGDSTDPGNHERGEDGPWLAEVFLDTRWQRGERVGQASFTDRDDAQRWVTEQLERLRVYGQLLGGEDLAYYLAELSQPPHRPVVNAYLFDTAEPIEWDDQSGEDDSETGAIR
jgi:hypothetical protein